jgi:hypothetical protein
MRRVSLRRRLREEKRVGRCAFIGEVDDAAYRWYLKAGRWSISLPGSGENQEQKSR